MTSSLNVLVVGGAGYIGTHMVKTLLNEGHNPITIDNLSTGHLALLPGGEFIKGDIVDADLMNHVFQSNRIDAVMHFASCIEVGESLLNPLKYHHNNVAATTNLLQCMLRNDVRRLIFSSSAAVYGEPQYTPIDENHLLAPTNPYGRTKQYVETILSDCASAHGMRYVSLRYFNAAGADPSATIGEHHQPESHLIPLLLAAAKGQREGIKIFGTDYDTPDGTCVRDYIHVNDLVDAHLLSLDSLINGGKAQIYNLGNSIGHSVKQVIKAVQSVTKKKINVTKSNCRPGDPATLVSDSKKIRTELGWAPKYENLNQMIKTAWDWHRRN